MEQAELQAIWEQILNNMRDQLAGSAFKWLDPIQPISLTESDLVLGTQTAMAKDWITSHYLTILEDAVAAVVGSPRKIVMKVIEAEKTPEEKERERLAIENQRLMQEGLENMMAFTGFGWKNGGKNQ